MLQAKTNWGVENTPPPPMLIGLNYHDHELILGIKEWKRFRSQLTIQPQYMHEMCVEFQKIMNNV